MTTGHVPHDVCHLGWGLALVEVAAGASYRGQRVGWAVTLLRDLLSEAGGGWDPDPPR